MALPPDFIERDLQAIVDEMIADYEARTGRILYPAQVERLLIDAFAYREMLVRQRVQYAAEQNLVDFANAPVLDYLGDLVGVQRLAASKATCLVEFSLVSGHGIVTIPAGTRVSTADGLVVFQTLNDELVQVITNKVTLEVESLTEGTSGNGLAINSVDQILDPQPFLSSAHNTTISGGGADQESDAALRERIKLAPSSFSNAGSRGAYEYFTRSANPAIIDVAVLGPNDMPASDPGEVRVYPLMSDGSTTPPTVITEVEEALNDEKVRPLTDLVNVFSPTKIDYTIEVDVTLYTDADPTSVQLQLESDLNAYALAKRQTLGQDIKRSQIVAKSIIPGQVYDVNVVEPSGDLIISAIEFGNCISLTVNIIGSDNG